MNVIAQGYKYREFGLKRYKMTGGLHAKDFSRISVLGHPLMRLFNRRCLASARFTHRCRRAFPYNCSTRPQVDRDSQHTSY
jgi:hypothetical protein